MSLTKIVITPTEVQRIAAHTYLLKTEDTTSISIQVEAGSIGQTVHVCIDDVCINVTDYDSW